MQVQKRQKRKYELYDDTTTESNQIRKKGKGNNDNDDDDNPLPFNPLELLKPQHDMIKRVGNHIYFRSIIDFESINKMGSLIQEAVDEYELLASTLRNVTVIPRPIYLHITSEGGNLLASMLGIDMIENSKIPVYTVVEGKAVSAGSLLSVSGKKRLMTPNSYILIHQLSSMEGGNFEQLMDSSKNNQEFMKRIKDIYLKSTKLTSKQLDEVLKHDIYWNFNKSLKAGLVDDVYKPDQIYVTSDE